jgi:simple sugar transport system ATP-binding protein
MPGVQQVAPLVAGHDRPLTRHLPTGTGRVGGVDTPRRFGIGTELLGGRTNPSVLVPFDGEGERKLQAAPTPAVPGGQPSGGTAVKVPFLEARELVKTYGHVVALDGASFSAEQGEVVALVGDNGAGKTTLVKHLAGIEQPDSGQILIDGEEVRLTSPEVARRYGIEIVYQDLALAGDLNTPANVFLGREICRSGIWGKMGFLNRPKMQAEAVATLARLGVSLKDPNAVTHTLSGGQQQSIAVARAVAFATKAVFMDEPTAALGVNQTRRVLDLIRAVRDAGTTVILISHNMPEVIEVADRIEVLRHGRRVARFRAGEATVSDLVAAMTGDLG